MELSKMSGNGYCYICADCVNLGAIDIKKMIDSLQREKEDSHGLLILRKSESLDYKLLVYDWQGRELKPTETALACAGMFINACRQLESSSMFIETAVGAKYLRLIIENGEVTAVEVDMGVPSYDISSLDKLIAGSKLNTDYTFVSIGEPFVVLFVDDLEKCPVEKLGRVIEQQRTYGNRLNVEFVDAGGDVLKTRTWERSAENPSSEKGACAAVVAGVLNGKCGSKSDVEMAGGSVSIEWEEFTNRVLVTTTSTQLKTWETSAVMK